jgi:prepilin-type N-terminal cleavage/methylation domain-containing protein
MSCPRVPSGSNRRAFTLIELLVVISIIAVIMGLAFPAFQGVQNSAKRTQTKNDLVQIVTAVNAYYTEYGKYPVGASGGSARDVTYGAGTGNMTLVRTLMGKDATENPRQIGFLSPPIAKEDGGYGVFLNSAGEPTGNFNSPWSKPIAQTEYKVRIDGDYDGQVDDPDDPARKLPQGVIAWSLGKNAAAPKIYSHK